VSSKIDEMDLKNNQGIIDLLWFEDGPFANYSIKEFRNSKLKFGNRVFEFDEDAPSEPSLISLFHPINPEVVIDPLNYNPNYSKLNPGQRFRYLSWLSNPLDEIEIGYVFLFYYGLERHLIYGKFDEAFEMILKLRQFHGHQSFQFYSLNALIISVLIKKRKDCLGKVFEELKNSHIQGSLELYLYAKFIFGSNLDSDELISFARKVGFANTNYIKKEYELFKKKMDEILIEIYEEPFFDLSVFDEYIPVPVDVLTFANVSLGSDLRMVTVPNFFQIEDFCNSVRSILSDVHQKVKNELRTRRKEPGYIPEKKEEIKLKDINVKEIDRRKLADYERLRESMDRKEERMNDTIPVLDRHFFYQGKIEINYKYRKENPEAFSLAVEACKQQISLSKSAKKAFLQEYPDSVLPLHVGYLQLSIIEEKRKNFENAIRLSENALKEGWRGDWKKRIQRLKKKSEKENNMN
jgi:hypothetical protein